MEVMAHYVVECLQLMALRGAKSMEVTQQAHDEYVSGIDQAMAGTVWTAGCNNYFRMPNGKVVTQLPYSGGRYWLRTRIFDRWRYRASRRRRTGPGG